MVSVSVAPGFREGSREFVNPASKLPVIQSQIREMGDEKSEAKRAKRQSRQV